MLLSLRSQWRDRAYRKSIYQSPRSLASKTANLSEYDRSATRSEVPSHYKKIEVPKVNAESVAIKRHVESFRDASVSSPLASPKQIPSLTRNASQKSQRPFYYLEDNEIISVDSFAGVYKNVKVFQKIQQKSTNKKDIEEKKMKMEQIKRSNSKQALCKSLSISTVDFCNPLFRNMSDSNPAVKIDNQVESMEADSTTLKFLALSPTASQFKNPSMVSSNQEDKTKISSYFKKQGRRYVKGLTTELTEESPITNVSISDQKMTEKEVNKHFISMTVSPRFVRNITSARKERNYNMMFKDPKTMDSAVENSIRSAHKKLISKIAASESHRYASHAKEATSPASSLDEIDKIDRMGKIKERDMLFRTESFAVSTREGDLRQGESIGKKIKDTIKHIDSVLRTSAITLSGAQSPKKPSRPKVEGVRVKNKFPLRSAVAQKYGLNDKINDQKRMALKMREVTSSYNKELKGSSMTDQRYQSFYHN